ncbi:unnamed protein product [Polarella glacialis]|uniref:Uncharacterized protein n=1 Tax=Polarella glacialis TaxID=89957 RepID=A0A813LNI8_POLGL|nr:unnamed protein product [Polarella glacialis]
MHGESCTVSGSRTDEMQAKNDQQQQTPGLEVGEDRQQPTKPHQQQRRKKQHKKQKHNTTTRTNTSTAATGFSTLSCRGNNNNKARNRFKIRTTKNLNIMKKDNFGREPFQGTSDACYSTLPGVAVLPDLIT